MKEELEVKVETITFQSMIQPGGISSNCLGYVIKSALEQFQKKYGSGNVWYDNHAIYIKTQLNVSAGGK